VSVRPTDTRGHSWSIETLGAATLDFSASFSSQDPPKTVTSVAQAIEGSRFFWKSFWSTGGAIDLSESQDQRWKELERRVVLSQYLTAVQSAGSMPPAETGLMRTDSWNGQFHMEMILWHLALFGLWDR